MGDETFNELRDDAERLNHADLKDLLRAYDAATVVVGAAERLHTKRTGTNDYMAPYEYAYCVEDRQVWPCATIQALDLATYRKTTGSQQEAK